MILDLHNLSVTREFDAREEGWFRNVQFQHKLAERLECEHYEHWMIGINNVIISQVFENNDQFKYYQIMTNEAYTSIKLENQLHGNVNHGPIICEQSTHNIYSTPTGIDYHPLIPKVLDTLNFRAIFPFVRDGNAYKNLSIKRNPTFTIIIQYSIIKVSSHPEMERTIRRVLSLTSNNKNIYLNNKPSNFRCDLLEPLNTSQETGHSYAQVNSITIPGTLDFYNILKEEKIYVRVSLENEPPRDDENTHHGSARAKVRALENSLTRFDQLSFMSEELANGDIIFKVEVPLFYSNDEDRNIRTATDLKKRIRDQLKPYQLQFTFANKKLRIKNNSEANIAIKFSNLNIYAALGIHDHKIRVKKKHAYVGDSKHDIYRLAPNSMFLFANFVDSSFINGRARRLLGVFDTTKLYTYASALEDGTMSDHHMTFFNYNPFMAKVNTDKLKHIHIQIETHSGIEFPFADMGRKSSSGTVVNLGFSM